MLVVDYQSRTTFPVFFIGPVNIPLFEAALDFRQQCSPLVRAVQLPYFFNRPLAGWAIEDLQNDTVRVTVNDGELARCHYVAEPLGWGRRRIIAYEQVANAGGIDRSELGGDCGCRV